MPSEMQVARDALSTTPPTKKPLGRNQKLAIWCYGVVAMVPMIPTWATTGVALARGDMETVLACVDRMFDWANNYGLYAVASILVVSGAIKGVGQVATMVGKWMDARKAEAEKPQP